MSKHTFQIIGGKTLSKSALIKQLREAKFTVSTDKHTNISTIQSQPTAEIVALCQTGDLRDTQAPTARKIRGAKTVATETPTAALRQRIQNEVDALVKPVVKRLYRRVQSGWAGGNTVISVKIQAEPYAAGDSRRVWSDNGKWSGNDAYLTVAVMYNYRRAIAAVPGLMDAGGMLTTHATRMAEDCWQAAWVKQGRGFDLNAETGYIVRSAEGEWCHAKTEQAARKLATKRDAEVRAERERLEKLANEKLAAHSDLIAHIDLVVTLADSRSAGNCQAGTESWVNRFFPGRTSATVREILAADPTNSRALAACRAAIRRNVLAMA